MLSASSSSVFFIQTNQLRVIELGLPVSESSTKISKFYDLEYSEHKFHKTRIENWLFIGFKLQSPWLETYSHNYYTTFNLQYGGES